MEIPVPSLGTIIEACLILFGAIGAWFRLESNSDRHDKGLEEVRKIQSEHTASIAENSLNFALLKKDVDAGSTIMSGLVKKLERVVDNLQEITIKIAVGEHGKAQRFDRED